MEPSETATTAQINDLEDRRYAAMREIALVLQGHFDRNLDELRKAQPLLIEVRPDLQDVLLVQIGDHIDRIELHDLGQSRLLTRRSDDIAGIDQGLAHLAERLGVVWNLDRCMLGP